MNITRRKLLAGAVSAAGVAAIGIPAIPAQVDVPVVPAGWLACDGRMVSRSIYPKLFDILGYAYGGDGEEFKLPHISFATKGTLIPFRISTGDAKWLMPAGSVYFQGLDPNSLPALAASNGLWERLARNG